MNAQAVVFDLGKVLVDFDYGIASRRLAANASATADEIRGVIDQTPLLYRYESAQMTTEEFFAEVRARIGFRGGFDEFAAAFADIFSEIPEMIELQAELTRRGVPTYVLSNTNHLAVGHIRRRFTFFGNFTGYVFSFEHAVLKPLPGIYEVAERMSGLRGEQLLFIDDRPENVEAALQRGWRTICHRTPRETIPFVQAALA